jgi:tRNA U38,U39,U40 pseudouridine synthase TruA
MLFNNSIIKLGINAQMVDNDFPLRISSIHLLKDSNFDCRRWAQMRTYMYRILLVDEIENVRVHEEERALLLHKNQFDLEKFREAALLF